MSDAPSTPSFCRLGPDQRLTLAQVHPVAFNADSTVNFDPQAIDAMQRSHAALLAAIDAGTPIYGVTTGFGPFVAFPSDAAGGRQHGQGLLAHLLAGHGPATPAAVVRATLLIRARSLSRGYSGIHPDAARQLLELLRRRVHPMIPQVGSVGASGDLTPLAYIAQVLAGRGEVINEQGQLVAAAEALAHAGLEPVELDSRDALAIVNGTSFMSAYLALAATRAQRLLSLAERLTGWLYRLLGCATQALDPRLHDARGHDGQRATAQHMLEEALRTPGSSSSKTSGGGGCFRRFIPSAAPRRFSAPAASSGATSAAWSEPKSTASTTTR